MLTYCISRFTTVRRKAREVMVGGVGIGGNNPLRVQSMTTTPTLDVAATVEQCRQLAEVGCEIVRITAQNVQAAKALGDIRAQLKRDRIEVPLVADIHFLPTAAMEAVKHVDKVRINPGNYADKKKFQIREYSDSQYDEELQRLHESFSPIVLRCKELGKSMRIGTNHGSLSDRVMNRYGDSPLGMVESALEFLRIAESHGFYDIVLSMKSSNPKVMMQAYRLMVAKMDEVDMHYPLHLGVTEAGDGDDARIKSAIGIGGLLLDGLGDTIRVSLTEDPVFEVPVARQLAEKVMQLWQENAVRTEPDPINPYLYNRRTVAPQIPGAGKLSVNSMQPPVVIQPLQYNIPVQQVFSKLKDWQARLGEARIEGLLLPAGATGATQIQDWLSHAPSWRGAVDFCIWPAAMDADKHFISLLPARDAVLLKPGEEDSAELEQWVNQLTESDLLLIIDAPAERLATLEPAWKSLLANRLIFTDSFAGADFHKVHPVGRYRQLAETLAALGCNAPIWIRHCSDMRLQPKQTGFGDQLLEASMLAGVLLCDGIGDYISVETVVEAVQSTTLAYNILQGARTRTTKTEYVACPSCGRTLFDLQTTTRKIRAATGHLKGVTIAVMGCIVNGPGEMADADFGYVGGAPGKINLYVGKQCVRFHIPAEAAVESLIALIKEHGKWQEP